MDFSWLSEFFKSLFCIFPHCIIVRATHGGVRWDFGKKIKELKPGWFWYIPLFTDCQVIVTARQTLKIPDCQAIETNDKISLAIGTLVVYSVNDVVKAIGKQNWDCDTTVSDITQSAVVHIINKYNYDYLINNLIKIEDELTETVKKELLKFGILIQQARFTNLARAEVKIFLGLTKSNEVILN